ncbi:uncharacterized protein BDW47DRAFT_98917 [Aspergillus candidus]|uniref:Uncharacterized protein n=1 Tax=Aspergillus candidus TaxID=41067 RepID=A0A2I2FMX4_ASPCN|nr:hypothetical protein BDW47DRAFT_98917 [Aspergillus candidus]PLB41983.1 hypothetical protein BDW47DRAFT_98917 [Aspergillus candidus]
MHAFILFVRTGSICCPFFFLCALSHPCVLFSTPLRACVCVCMRVQFAPYLVGFLFFRGNFRLTLLGATLL